VSSSAPTTTTPAPTAPPASSAQCGTCTGCLWVEPKVCYKDWSQATCNIYATDGYVYVATFFRVSRGTFNKFMLHP
jgi:hypothetical protein